MVCHFDFSSETGEKLALANMRRVEIKEKPLSQRKTPSVSLPAQRKVSSPLNSGLFIGNYLLEKKLQGEWKMHREPQRQHLAFVNSM